MTTKAPSATVLDLRGVSRIFKVGESEVRALDGVTTQIDEGEFVAIVGPSGSGKSTLLQILGLLDRPSEGTVLLDGLDVGKLSDGERTDLRLRSIGFVFQRFHLLSELSALENVTLPMEAAGVPLNQRIEQGARLLQSVGMGDRLDFRPARLSGGQRQRVAVARAFANDPRIVFADEPTGELHSDDKGQVIELFKRFNRSGHTLVIVTHDPEVAAVADRRIEIRDGRIRQSTDGRV